MDVYFIRHGETDGNVARRHQHQDTELNEIGKVQAKEVAKKVAELKPTHIVSSTDFRAIETTKIIITECMSNLIPETHPAFQEFKRPDWLVGNRYLSLVSAGYVWRWLYNSNKTKGDESYANFLERIIEARSYLESLPEDSRVVVVSHAVFINIFIEHLCSDKPMGLARAIRRFWKVLTLRNTSIIHLSHANTAEGTCAWSLVK
jgi:broad specificity phosphatase PhoE